MTPQDALAARVRTAASVILDEVPGDTGTTIEALVRAVTADEGDDRVWLLMACLSTVVPEPDLLRTAGRFLRSHTTGQSVDWLLDQCLTQARHHGQAAAPVRVLQDAVLVDVDYSAQHDVHRGIQRVVRELLPRWHAAHEVVPVVWTRWKSCFRTLDTTETRRTLAWGDASAGTERTSEVVIPWRSVVVLTEVPVGAVCPRIAAMAQTSGNAVTAIGYDMVPVASADMLAAAHANRFVLYLAAVKHLRKVAGISVSAATEFRGFSDMLPAQGMAGPEVVECRLPTQMSSVAGVASSGRAPAGAPPSVLSIGSLEPRKNPLTLLHAAERLWREGHVFSLTILSAGAINHEPEAWATIKGLQLKKRDLRLLTAISDADLKAEYERARFTVFVSLHEGYGLPVAESLVLGTPVITTAYGSTREIAEEGGALLVDPRSDEEVYRAMRLLLTDDAELARLRADIAGRSQRTWDDYATELWAELVAPFVGHPADRPVHKTVVTPLPAAVVPSVTADVAVPAVGA